MLIQKDFKEYISFKIIENEKMVVNKKKLTLDAKPGFIDLFRKSSFVASKSNKHLI